MGCTSRLRGDNKLSTDMRHGDVLRVSTGVSIGQTSCIFECLSTKDFKTDDGVHFQRHFIVLYRFFPVKGGIYSSSRDIIGTKTVKKKNEN